MNSRLAALGVAAGVASGLCYGATTVIGRALARVGMDAPTVLGVRFGVGALVLFATLAVRGRSLLPEPGERWAAALLGLVGYGVESSLFFMGLQRGSAGTVTLLFYAYPAIVVVADLVLGREHVSGRLLCGLALATAGTGLVLAGGAGGSISLVGAGFAMAAAVTFAAYLIASDHLLVRTDPVVRAAWVSGGAAVALLSRGLLTGTLQSPGEHVVTLLAIGLANAGAFGFLFMSLARLGSSRAAVVLNTEPVAAVALGAVFLAEVLGPLQLAGGALVVVAAVLVAMPAAPAAAAPP